MGSTINFECPGVQTSTCGKGCSDAWTLYCVGMERGGKRSNPDYTKITIYMRVGTRQAAAHKLVGASEDLSEVVERLVAAWAAGDIDLTVLPQTQSLA